MPAKKTAAKPQAPVTFEVDAGDLLRALHNARLFICPDVYLPVLRCVQVEGQKDWLTFTATDRYMLGRTRIAYTGKAFSFSMQEADSALLLRLFNAKSGQLEVTVHERTMTVQPAKGVVDAPQVVVTMTSYDGEFPKYKQIIDKARDGETDKTPYTVGETIGFNPRYLAKFARVKASEGGMTALKLAVHSASAPIYAKVGEDFEGIIMPVRLADEPASVRPKESAA